MANKVQYGLKNVYYAILDEDNLTYSTPVAIPGAVSLSLDNQASSDSWYADDLVYIVVNGATSYSGTLEVAILPDTFREDVLGEEITTQNNSTIASEKDNTPTVSFALLFEFSGDAEQTRHVMYRCIAGRPSIASSTKEDSVTPQTESIDITATALSNDYVRSRATESSQSGSAYSTWFTSVYTPWAAATPTNIEAAE